MLLYYCACIRVERPSACEWRLTLGYLFISGGTKQLLRLLRGDLLYICRLDYNRQATNVVILFQASRNLSRLSSQKEQAEGRVEETVNKASEAMEGLRRAQGKPWDGKRVNDPRRRSPEILKAEVGVFSFFRRG